MQSSPGSFVNYSITHFCWLNHNSVTKNSMHSMPHPWKILQMPTYATVLMLRWHFKREPHRKIALLDILGRTIKEGLFLRNQDRNLRAYLTSCHRNVKNCSHRYIMIRSFNSYTIFRDNDSSPVWTRGEKSSFLISTPRSLSQNNYF